MKVVFRADASVELGAGHVMRCLALADSLKARGVATHFISREQPGHLCELIEAKGHALTRLPAQAADSRLDAEHSAAAFAMADWLVVDHYGLDATWERALRARARRLLVIDDLADRPHDCDLLLDQNLQPEAHARYAALLPAGCATLFGPRHALLRPQFAANRATPRERRAVRRLLVFFGGADAGGETLKALAALARLEGTPPAVDVVIGQANPHRAAIERACQALPAARLHCQVEDMAALMAAADLAIGAGGTAAWERCCLGLPCLTLAIAENQYAPAAALAEAGGQLYLGASAQVPEAALAQALAVTLALPELRAHLSRRGMELVDGRGVERVANRLLVDRVRLRAARPEDSEVVHAWRNHPETRAASFSAEAIPFASHARWYADVLADPGRHLLIGEEDGQPLGVLRYDLDARAPERAVVSLYLVPGLGGQGYGTRLLLAGHRWLAERHPGITRLEAAIRAGNAASRGAFEAAGFTLDHATYRKELDAHA